MEGMKTAEIIDKPLPPISKEKMDEALQKLKDNIVKPQKVCGKEFKGPSFISSPPIIEFIDFEADKTYTLKITLTNISYSFNSYKILQINKEFRDFFTVEYTPAGRMSAGLSSIVVITFNPKINTDINTELPLLTETGDVVIPIKCTCKKAIVSSKTESVSFGEVFYGDSATANYTIENTGALPTDFKIVLRDKQALPIVEELKDFNPLKLAHKLLNKQEIECGLKADSEKEKLSFDNLPDLLSQLRFEYKGRIEGYSKKTVTFNFHPVILGSFNLELSMVFSVSDHSSPIDFDVNAICSAVAVYVEKPLYDLNICVFDQIYREKLVLYNRTKHPMRIDIKCPEELSSYIEFNPVLGYIQEEDKFEIWMKFKPNAKIIEDAAKYLKEDILEFLITVNGANQSVPVIFKVKAVLTSDNLEYTQLIDFGTVTKSIAKSCEVAIKNKSILPQKIYFIALPKEIEILPYKGLITLLPLESQTIQINFTILDDMEGIAEGYLRFRSILGENCSQEWKISYKAIKTFDIIELSSNQVRFPIFSENEIAETTIRVSNKDSRKVVECELVCPPNNMSGLVVSPSYFSLDPKSSKNILIQYTAKIIKLDPFAKKEEKKVAGIPMEALRNNLLESALKPKEIAEDTSKKQGGKKEGGKKDEKKDSSKKEEKKESVKKEEKKQANAKKNKKQEEEEEAKRKKDEEELKIKEDQEKQKIIKEFDQNKEFIKYGGKLLTVNDTQHFSWILQLHTKADTNISQKYITITTVCGSVLLSSDKTELNFGELAVSCKKTMQVVVTNNDTITTSLSINPLPIYSGFQLQNALRDLEPGKSIPLILQFEPNAHQKFEENLVIHSDKAQRTIKLLGIGVRPEVSITPENGLIEIGTVLVDGEKKEKLKITNISKCPAVYSIKTTNKGLLNRSGKCVFSYVPFRGTINPGESSEIEITFNPELESSEYYEKILIDIPNQVNPKSILLRGAASMRQLWCREYFPLEWPSVYNISSAYITTEQSIREKRKILLKFNKDGKRQIAIGACKASDPKNDKGGSYEITLASPYFSVDLPKGNLGSASTSQIVNFTFKPPGIDPILQNVEDVKGIGQWIECRTEVKLIGGQVPNGEKDIEVYEILLRGYAEQI